MKDIFLCWQNISLNSILPYFTPTLDSFSLIFQTQYIEWANYLNILNFCDLKRVSFRGYKTSATECPEIEPTKCSKSIQSAKTDLMYRVRAPLQPAVCMFFTHFLKSKNVFSRRFFLKILAFYMVSIQVQFLIKSGLYWRVYGM